jgi:hypothetical protein
VFDGLADALLLEEMKAALRRLLVDPSVVKLCFSFAVD